MIEFIEWLLRPTSYYQEKHEERVKRLLPKMTTSYILELAEAAEELKPGTAEILFKELARRVKNTGIPLDNGWI